MDRVLVPTFLDCGNVLVSERKWDSGKYNFADYWKEKRKKPAPDIQKVALPTD